MKISRLSMPSITFFGMLTPKVAGLRAMVALRRNRLYLKSEEIRALLSSGGARKILFSGKPDWIDDIKRGFQRSPHQVEFGSISADSFQRYDIVVPLSLPALKEARRCSPLQKNALPLPSEESVRLCDDKYKFIQALIEAGFGRYIPRAMQGVGLIPPYILKKRIGTWGKDCYIIRNYEDEGAQLDKIKDPDYFCQELVLGPTEFATHILFIDGRIVKALNIKYQFADDTPIKGQNPELHRSIHRCPYLNLFEQVLGAIQFEGLCCVNYKVVSGQPLLLEINPRFGGSLAPYFSSFVRHFR